MQKAFLSHSSFDKDFVAQVYAELGAAYCIFDNASFSKNSDLPLQIRSGINDCSIYVLFLSQSAIQSKWVNSELDIANELKTKQQIKKIVVFQLDGTHWDQLPSWTHRYISASFPSPKHISLQILNIIKNEIFEEKLICVGRSEVERQIVSEISESDTPPSYIYFSGPIGIGRRTVASSVYSDFFPHLNTQKIRIKVDSVDDITDIYRHALGYSANWRAYDLKSEMDRLTLLKPSLRIKELAILLKKISVDFRQVVILDLGTSALTEEGRPQPWFLKLTQFLEPADYPYIWFLSQRFLNGSNFKNGLFFNIDPLDEKWSIHLFRILIKKSEINIPDKKEQQLIEGSIIGHPGLITLVANYLKKNPHYKPNRTHNNLVKLINEQVQYILFDFIGKNLSHEKAVALFSEADILSYDDIKNISLDWPEFEKSTSALIDAGLVIRNGVDYSLVPYIQRAAANLAEKHHASLTSARKTLLSSLSKITEDSFISVNLLDARIIDHILNDIPIEGYLSNIITPSQQIKAARRKYDAQNYKESLKLAKIAYAQNDKLSQNGQREAWRLIGLSATRDGNSADDFDFFVREYSRITKSPQTDAIYFFGNGLKERLSGNLKSALQWYEKINQGKYADSHVYREMAYIYAFQKSFDKAYICVTKAHDLALGNPYILDILAMILIEQYKNQRGNHQIEQIDLCLKNLKEADKREGTNFYYARSLMRDVVIDNDIHSLHNLFDNRKNLPTSAKVALLGMLSLKGKDIQFNEMHGELLKIIREKKKPLARIEIARIDIERYCYKGQFKEAEELLQQYEPMFPEKCYDELLRLLPKSSITPKKNARKKT